MTSNVVGRHPNGSCASRRVTPTGQHRPIRLQALTHHLQAELVEAAERAEIRAHEGSVKHVEVFGWVA